MTSENESYEPTEQLTHSGTEQELDNYIQWLVPRYEDGVTEMAFSVESECGEAFGMVFLSCEMFTTKTSELKSLRDRAVAELDKYIAQLTRANAEYVGEDTKSA